MASFVFQSPFLQKSTFHGETHHLCHHSRTPKFSSISCVKPTAKFNLFEILGGRGLLNGEQGVEKLLKTPIEKTPKTSSTDPTTPSDDTTSTAIKVDANAFEKELLGLTGGFPGGEKGLQTFLEKNPPPPKKDVTGFEMPTTKMQPPQLPLLMPGMIAIVKNPNHPFYMYTGIIQRITDGKAGVLFEGGNWDKLITFRLDELERREKGPPMVNPKSAVLEAMVQKE